MIQEELWAIVMPISSTLYILVGKNLHLENKVSKFE